MVATIIEEEDESYPETACGSCTNFADTGYTVS